METNQSLFSLSIDPLTKSHLSETARWARFLAILGFVSLALLVLGGVVMAVTFSSATSALEDAYDGPTGMIGNWGAAGMAFVYIVVAAIMFFPLLFLYRFAGRMRTALAGNDQNALNESFLNLKSYFRFFGILAIIWLVLYALIMLFTVIGMAAMA